jgi:hypothetical protein
MKVTIQNNGFKFSLTMELIDNTLKVVESLDTFTFLPWFRGTCHLSKQTLMERNSNSSCLRICKEHFLMRPDGLCEQLFTIINVISDDNYPLTKEELKAFPQYIRCFLISIADFVFENEFSPTMMFDKTPKTNVYGTFVHLYDSFGDSELHWNLKLHLIAEAKSIKVLESQGLIHRLKQNFKI